MAKHKSQKMFGAMDTKDDLAWVGTWTIKMSAREVRKEVGRAWCIGDPVEGWKAARNEGMRVVKVEIRVTG